MKKPKKLIPFFLLLLFLLCVVFFRPLIINHEAILFDGEGTQKEAVKIKILGLLMPNHFIGKIAIIEKNTSTATVLKINQPRTKIAKETYVIGPVSQLSNSSPLFHNYFLIHNKKKYSSF